jgi:hypothetical protein
MIYDYLFTQEVMQQMRMKSIHWLLYMLQHKSKINSNSSNSINLIDISSAYDDLRPTKATDDKDHQHIYTSSLNG